MIVLQAADVRKALPMDETTTAMKRAFAALSGGRARMPLRIRLEVPPYEGESMFMPVFIDDTEGEKALAVKIVSVFPRNTQRGVAHHPRRSVDAGCHHWSSNGAVGGRSTDSSPHRCGILCCH